MIRNSQQAQPWIYSVWSDSIFVLAPPFLVLLAVLFLPEVFRDNAEVSPAAWILLVLCIDVAHVYSTMYRTYFDRELFQQRKNLFLLTPILVFIGGVLLYSVSSLLFWRIAAYLAVFHFIRQQYGFLRIYSRRQQEPGWAKRLDTVVIYTITLYPIIWWHLNGPRHFSWFIPDDFYFINLPFLNRPLEFLYWMLIAGWITKEFYFVFYKKQFNLPRFLLMTGTGMSWYIGIVSFNGDLVFTALNVISHGIPYMALIWMYGNKKNRTYSSDSFSSRIFRLRNLPWFIGILIAVAYVEEGFWDSLVWKDHPGLFRFFDLIPAPPDYLLAFIVPLLTVPQLTHYVLDGFIWKIQKDQFNWKEITLGK